MEKNPLPFDPREYVRKIEGLALAGGWTLRYLSPTKTSPRPWLQRRALSSESTPSIYLSSGIHGDEFSGPWAMLEMLAQPDFFTGFDAMIFPLLNPDGLARGIRENASGIDLNRDYRKSRSPEILSHIKALQTLGRFDAAMMLHEDYEGLGAYLYELNEELPAQLGHDIISAMGHHVPIDERPEIEEVPAHGGVISRRDLIALHGKIEDRPEWPEAIYLSVHHTKVSYTTETPKPFPLAQRVQAQIAAVRTLMEELQNKVRPI